MEYQITKEDLEKCFNFALEYHLDEKKLASNRTTGQYRGLGGIIDSFFIGKIIEIGVESLLGKQNQKECILDFDIHQINKENRSDPDIIRIREKGVERGPKLYIEIKNISSADRWVGLTVEQFNTILGGKIVGKDPKKVFIVYASLISKSQEKDGDLLGVYLKSKIDLALLKRFCNEKDLFVKILYIISGEELLKHGVKFNEGSYMYETDLFEEVGERTKQQILNSNNAEIFKRIETKGNLLPIIMRDNMPKPKEFGEFKFNGNLEVYLKKNVKSKRMYIRCKTNVTIKNNILGFFHLKKGKIYDCFFATVGWNPRLKRNNIWIAQRNLQNILSKSIPERVGEIMGKI